jgi:hypothetical protein
VDDLVEGAFVLDHRLIHEFVVYRRHAPDSDLDGTAVTGALGQLRRGEVWFGLLLPGVGPVSHPAQQSAGYEQRSRRQKSSRSHDTASQKWG